MNKLLGLLFLLLSFCSNATTVVDIQHKLKPDELESLGIMRIKSGSVTEHDWIVISFPKRFKETLSPIEVKAIFKRHGEEIITVPVKPYLYENSVHGMASFTIRKNDNLEAEVSISYGIKNEISDTIVIGNINNIKVIDYYEYEKRFDNNEQN